MHQIMIPSLIYTAEEVDTIFHSPKENHGSKYTPEQLRTWAHMLHLGTHDSCEYPPDKPFFRSSQWKRPNKEQSGSSTPKGKRLAVLRSPGTRGNLTSELIEQLKKCAELVDAGAMSDEVFHDL